MATAVRPTARLDLEPVPLDPAEGYDGKAYLQVEVRLYHIAQNPTSHFSVTGAIGTKAQLRNGNWQGGGCCHEIILKHFPELAPIVALHLSDEDGVPMHAEANANYWAGLSSFPDAKDVTVLAKHLRITLEDAEALTTKEAVAAKVEEMRPVWKAEAEAAIEQMGGLV